MENVNQAIGGLKEEIQKFNRDAEGGEENKIFKKLSALLNKLSGAEEADDIEKLKKLLEEIKSELQKIIAREDKEEAEKINLVRDALEEKMKAKEILTEKLSEAALQYVSAREKLRILAEREKGMDAELKNLEEKLKKSEGQEKEGGDGEKGKDLNSKLKRINEEALRIREKIEINGASQEEERRHLFKIQRSIQELQNELSGLAGELSELRVSGARYETRLEELEKEIRNSLVDLKNVKQFSAGEEEIDIEASREKITSLKRQLELIGGIDPEIEKEYLSSKERHDFLSEQVNDLTQAIDSLQKIIKELDITIKERFDKEFKIISNKFEEYFKILFNGGHAKIIKVMESDMAASEPEGAEELIAGNGENGEISSASAKAKAEKASAALKASLTFDLNKIKFLQKHNATGLAGIEIQATPPGKKIRSISMLSGGERALTAIALICAIISANPSPFVVLDEVDAALDEANSERLAKILDDLSHKTQFIVITHNRASMRRANILYGVTMQDDGASKLLSIKLEEAVDKAIEKVKVAKPV